VTVVQRLPQPPNPILIQQMTSLFICLFVVCLLLGQNKTDTFVLNVPYYFFGVVVVLVEKKVPNFWTRFEKKANLLFSFVAS
jgi:hypothetical protein